MNMKGIDIIIPVHMYDEEVSVLLKRCLTSTNNMAMESQKNGVNVDVMIIAAPNLNIDINSLTDFDDKAFHTIEIIENDKGDIDFCSQVNFGVQEHSKNDYFMIVEFDDMVTPKWVNMALPYIETREKCPLFLPLVEVYDIVNNARPYYYINEIGWSSSFADNELGVISNSALKDYCNFNITGAIIKRNDFVKAGGLKPSMKLSFGYELLLRLSNLYDDIFVVPKVGYFHFINRKNSLTSEYHDTMSKEEGSWWINLALEEYTFKKDRKKEYNSENK